MPTIVKADTLIGSEIDVSTLAETAVRGFYIAGMVLGTGPEPGADMLYSILKDTPGLPQVRAPHPTRPNLLLSRYRVFPTSSDQARVLCYYELPQFNGQSAYVITDDTRDEMRSTQFIPGTREPVRVYYNSKNDPGYTAEFLATYDSPPDFQGAETPTTTVPPLIIPADNLTFTAALPIRVITIQQLLYGRPPETFVPTQVNNGATPPGSTSSSKAQFLSCVNKDPWCGYDTGYWKLSGYTSRYSRYEGFFTVQASVVSRVLEDWSTMGILRQQQTGRYVPVSKQAIAALAQAKYRYGPNAPEGQGIARIGPYPLADFAGLFGFSSL